MQEIIRYQEIDAEIRKLENELFSSKNRKGASEMQQFLKDGQTKLLKIEEVAENLTKQYQKATALYNEFVTKIETLSKNIESFEGAKLKELEGVLNNFINSANNLENNINALAGKIASVNKDFEGVMNNAKKAKHNLEIYKNNYNKEKERLDPEISRLKNELLKQKSKVEVSVLNKYLSKVESKIFPIYVPEIKGRCGGCRMEISAGKLSDLAIKKAVECENCGRFIYKN